MQFIADCHREVNEQATLAEAGGLAKERSRDQVGQPTAPRWCKTLADSPRFSLIPDLVKQPVTSVLTRRIRRLQIRKVL